MLIADENRIWIRTTNLCNSRCVFCLEDPWIKKLWHIKDEIIFQKIKKWFRKNFKNKLILSGWEASSNPNLIEFIKYWKKIWYDKIQTITNGIRWSDLNYCTSAVESGLDEITFSIHGHNSSIHDSLVWVKWAFKNIIIAIHNFKKYFPQVIINCDIVVNRQNIKWIYKLLQLLKKMWITEFDILQIIPFGSAWENKDKLLFDNVEDYYGYFQNIFKEWDEDWIVMWTNRLFPYLLEWYERFIQTPEKIRDEVANESKIYNLISFDSRKPLSCKDKSRCKNCYLNDFCDQLQLFYDKEKNWEIKSLDKKSYKLFSDKDLRKLDIYPVKIDDFVDMIRKRSVGSQVINIPYCIVNSSNYFTNFNDSEKEKKFDNFIDWYENEWFRVKSLNCRKCKFNKKCLWIHINIIKKYWFKILSPII